MKAGSFLPNLELLVGSAAFWSRAEQDMKAARRRLLVQALTFEGDDAGLAVASALHEGHAAERRVLVDDFTRAVVNDRFVLSPFSLASRAQRTEIRATRAMFRGLQRAGIGVRATNLIAGSPFRYGLRNHKKLIVADDVAFIGGVNFSDHNFAWHDLMLRIEGAGPADFLAADFDATWHGRAAFAQAGFGPLGLYALDGRTNPKGLADLMEAIDGAAQRIEIITPYLSFPFTDRLAAAARRGVEIVLSTPWPSNKPMVRDYQLSIAARAGFTVQPMARMSHLKAMLIDGTKLVLGSINFDFPSYYSLEEYVAIIEDEELIADFRARVLDPIGRDALRDVDWRPPLWRTLRSRLLMHLAGAVVARSGRIRRNASDWRE